MNDPFTAVRAALPQPPGAVLIARASDGRKVNGKVNRGSNQFEDGFDFHRDAAGQRIHADCAAGADACVRAEYLSKQLAATIDDGWLLHRSPACTGPCPAP